MNFFLENNKHGVQQITNNVVYKNSIAYEVIEIYYTLFQLYIFKYLCRKIDGNKTQANTIKRQ